MRRCSRVGSTVCCLAMAGTALWRSSSCLLPVCLQTDTCCGCTEQRWRPTLGASALMAQYSDVRSIALLRCRRWDSIEAKQGHQQAYLNSSWCKAPGSCILAHAKLDLVQQFHLCAAGVRWPHGSTGVLKPSGTASAPAPEQRGGRTCCCSCCTAWCSCRLSQMPGLAAGSCGTEARKPPAAPLPQVAP